MKDGELGMLLLLGLICCTASSRLTAARATSSDAWFHLEGL